MCIRDRVGTAHGMDYIVNPIEGLELFDQLHDAVKYIHGTYQEAELPELLCVWQGFGCFGTAGAGMERRDENAAVSF